MLARLVIFVCASLPGIAAISSFAPAQDPPAKAADAGLDPLARGIVGTPHDFSAAGQVARDLCLPCHTPHITAAQAPLLVQRPAAVEATRAYGTSAGELNAASLVCLSCHDGTIARDVYAGTHAMTWAELSAVGVAAGRTRLTNHPVGTRYPTGTSACRRGVSSARHATTRTTRSGIPACS
jgi:hypothetical protein